MEALSLLKSYVDCTAQQGADGADAEGGRRDGERGGALLDGSLLEAKLDVNVHEGRAEALRLEIERQTDGWR
ncbi:unnamed protein product, partial [Durusdinium trenchii]